MVCFKFSLGKHTIEGESSRRFIYVEKGRHPNDTHLGPNFSLFEQEYEQANAS